LGRIEVAFAIRFDRPKRAVIAAMSQASSSSKPCVAQRRVVGLADRARLEADLHREREHRLLARRDVGLPVVDGDLVGDERILLVDAQDRAVRDHAVQAVVRAARRDHDHFLLALRQARRLQHQRVVVREERPELVRAVREREETRSARSRTSPAPRGCAGARRPAARRAAAPGSG
jgi:hypothetical protein